jgi:hypothetical protein
MHIVVISNIIHIRFYINYFIFVSVFPAMSKGCYFYQLYGRLFLLNNFTDYLTEFPDQSPLSDFIVQSLHV